MKSLTLVICCIILLPLTTLAVTRGYKLSTSLDVSFMSPTSLNGYRDSIANSFLTPQGKFDKMYGYRVSFGKRVGELGMGTLEYATASQTLPDSDYTSGRKLVNSFTYKAVYLTYDYRLIKNAEAAFYVGLGLGKTLEMEYNEQITNGSTDAMVWTGSAMPMKIRAIYEDFMSTDINFFVMVEYESVSSSLKAKDNYNRGLFGRTVTKDQSLVYFDPSGAETTADLSGIRVCAGASITF